MYLGCIKINGKKFYEQVCRQLDQLFFIFQLFKKWWVKYVISSHYNENDPDYLRSSEYYKTLAQRE